MILRNNAHPRGKDMGPVRVWEVPMLSPIGAMGMREGESYRALSRRIVRHRVALAEARKRRPKPEPVVLHVACPGPNCGVIFETTNPSRVWCSQACVWRARRKRNHVPKSRKRPEVYAKCDHPEKPMVARGMCHTCYMREWRKGRRDTP